MIDQLRTLTSKDGIPTITELLRPLVYRPTRWPVVLGLGIGHVRKLLDQEKYGLWLANDLHCTPHYAGDRCRDASRFLPYPFLHEAPPEVLAALGNPDDSPEILAGIEQGYIPLDSEAIHAARGRPSRTATNAIRAVLAFVRSSELLDAVEQGINEGLTRLDEGERSHAGLRLVALGEAISEIGRSVSER